MLNLVIGFIVPLAYLLGFTSSLVFLTKRSFGKCLPLSMMLSAFLLFFSQLIFGTFNVGFIVGVIFAFASIVLGIIYRRRWNEYKKLLFTSGFIVFLTVYVLVFIYDLARGFSVWDEFSHWGMMLKEMTRLDKFYYVETSNLMVHKDYPPIMQLFELFWIKLCGGEFNETFALRALHTFELTLFVPFVTEKVAEKKNCVKSILVGVAMTLSVAFIILLFDQHGVFQTIYTDYVMAVVVAYLVVTVFVSQKVDWFEILALSIGGGFLLLLKQMGLPLYLMILCLFVGIIIVREGRRTVDYLKSKNKWKIMVAALMLLSPFILWFVWGRLVADVSQQFSLSSSNLKELADVLLGGGEDWQRFTAKKYLLALGEQGISTSYVQMSFIQGIVLFVGTMWLVWKEAKGKLDKRKMVWTTVLLVFGALGYSGVMLLLYVTSFGSYEGPILASYERYMGTYLMMLLLVVFLVMSWHVLKEGKRGIVYLACAVLSLVIAPGAYSRLYPYIMKTDNNVWYSNIADKLTEKLGADEKVFIIAQDKVGFNYYFEYYATPMLANSYGYNWPIDEEVDAEEYFESVVLPQLGSFNYLYVANVDEKFNDKYCGKNVKTILDCPVENNTLYKIIKSDKGVTFTSVE